MGSRKSIFILKILIATSVLFCIVKKNELVKKAAKKAAKKK